MNSPVSRRSGSMALWVTAGAVTLAHLLVINNYGIFRDELYYIACSKRLAWGYVDHPPLVAAITWAGRLVFGESLAALRAIPIAFGAALIFITGALVRRLGGGAFAQALAAVAVSIPLHYLFIFHIMSMNSAEVVLWALASYLIVSGVQTSRRWPWLLFGLVAGLGLLNKHSMLFLGLGIFVGLALTSSRQRLTTPWPWIAGAIAAAIFAPHVLWQIQHGWPILEFVRNAQENKIEDISPILFLAEQITLMNPVTLPVWLGGLWFFGVRREGRPYRLFIWCYLTVLLVLLMQRTKPYYLTPIYPVLFAGGAVLIEHTIHSRRVRTGVLAVMVAGGVVLAPWVLPILPIPTFLRYSSAFGIQPSSGERHEMGALPQHFADMFGWEDLARTISTVYGGLGQEERRSTRVFARNYGEAGALEYFRDRYDLPAVISPHNNYWYWGPGPDGGTIIIIGGTRDDHLKALSNVEEVARTSCRLCMPYEQNRPVFVGRGWKVSLNAIWPREKDFN